MQRATNRTQTPRVKPAIHDLNQKNARVLDAQGNRGLGCTERALYIFQVRPMTPTYPALGQRITVASTSR